MANTKKTATATATAAATPKIVSTALDELLAHPASVYATAPTELKTRHRLELNALVATIADSDRTGQARAVMTVLAELYIWLVDNVVSDESAFESCFNAPEDFYEFGNLYLGALGELTSSAN